MATLNVCDICGKVISSDSQKKRYFKIKELKPYDSCDGWRSNHWEKIDAHNSCIEMLLKAKEINEGYGDIF